MIEETSPQSGSVPGMDKDAMTTTLEKLEQARDEALERCRCRRQEASKKVRFNGGIVARFLKLGEPDDGTLRCISCGQIDDDPWHKPDLCFGIVETRFWRDHSDAFLAAVSVEQSASTSTCGTSGASEPNA